MKVICAGFPKTGTKSLAMALRWFGWCPGQKWECNVFNIHVGWCDGVTMNRVWCDGQGFIMHVCFVVNSANNILLIFCIANLMCAGNGTLVQYLHWYSQLRELGYTVHDYPEHVALGEWAEHRPSHSQPSTPQLSTISEGKDRCTHQLHLYNLFHLGLHYHEILIVVFDSGLDTYLAFFQGRVGTEVGCFQYSASPTSHHDFEYIQYTQRMIIDHQ